MRIAVEFLDDEPVAIHKIHYEYRDPGFYRQAVSMEAFGRRNRDRLLKFVCPDGVDKGMRFVRVPGRRFSLKFEDDFEFDLKFEDRTYYNKGPMRMSPVIEYSSVWAFYEAVGYDKAKRKLKDW